MQLLCHASELLARIWNDYFPYSGVINRNKHARIRFWIMVPGYFAEECTWQRRGYGLYIRTSGLRGRADNSLFQELFGTIDRFTADGRHEALFEVSVYSGFWYRSSIPQWIRTRSLVIGSHHVELPVTPVKFLRMEE